MEENKENTRIPLPQYPLPPIPERLIGEYKKQTNTAIQRVPLRTLNDQRYLVNNTRRPENEPSAAGPSSTKPNIISSTPLGLDTRYVTVRRGDHCRDRVDRDLELFNYQEPTGSVESGPVDTDETDVFNNAICEENVNEESPAEQANARYVTLQKGDQRLDRVLEDLDDEEPTGSAKTPANKKKLSEPARVKKLKSLKRPHSKELQGIQRSEDNERLSGLRYQRLSENLNPPDTITIQLSERLLTYFEPDTLEYLLKSEQKASPTQFIHKSARACIVNWLMKVNGPNGNPAVLQTACWFLDAILGRKAVPTEQLQLKASACFWIAQKLYQQTTVTSTKLAKLADNGFLQSQLLDAEKEVLMLLGFPRQPVVPQDFIGFFAWTCDKEQHGLIEMAATFFAMCSLLFHTNYCCELPSVVAAASVKNACICLERTDLEAKLESCSWYKKAEAKAVSFKRTCSAQRCAVRSGALPAFKHINAPHRHYGQLPLNLAQRMVAVSARLSSLDASRLPSSWLHLL